MADYQETPAEQTAKKRAEWFSSGSSPSGRGHFTVAELNGVRTAAQRAANDVGLFGAGYTRMWVEGGVLKIERVDPRTITIASKPAPEETARRSLLDRLKTTTFKHVMTHLYRRNCIEKKHGSSAARVALEAVEAVFDALGVKTIQAVEFDRAREKNAVEASLRRTLLAEYWRGMVHSEPSRAEVEPGEPGTELHTFAITKLPKGYNKGSAR